MMSAILLLLLGLGSFTVPVSGHEQDGNGCGVTHPPMEKVGRDLARMNRFGERRRMLFSQETCHELCKGCIEIETYFHLMVLSDGAGGFVMPHPPETMDRQIQGDPTLTVEDYTTVGDYIPLLVDQINLLNEAFADTPFRFKPHGSASVHNVIEWIYWPMDHLRTMTELLGQKDPKKLDVFISYQVVGQDPNSTQLAGFADFPSHQYTSGDGAFIRTDSLPGGGGTRWHSGYALVHEVGHWLGLHHTWENWGGTEDPCFGGRGDGIDDTPPMAQPTGDTSESCMEWADIEGDPVVDTCPDTPGLDPVFNFMNYLDDDACFATKGVFSCNQIERMYSQWLLYRDFVSICEAGEMELEIVYQFDKFGHFENNNYIILVQDSEPVDVIFDSRYDHQASQVQLLQDLLFVDLCVDASTPFVLMASDNAGNGFTGGAYAEIFRNGESMGKIEGNFGPDASVFVDSLI